MVDTFCRRLVYYKSVHTSCLEGTHRDENWVKVFFLFMPHEQQEAPTCSINDLMVQPCGMKISSFLFCVYKKHHRNLFDVFIMHVYAWKFHLSHFGGTSSIMMSFCTRTKIADEEFHVWLEDFKNMQFSMGRDELPVWWYDFHNLIFILYNDNFLLFLLMGGRR